MRALFWLVALFGVAVASALFVGHNQGTVTLYWPPHRIDVALNLALLLLLVLVLVLYVALRALALLLGLPGAARAWRVRSQERALQLALLDALAQLIGGRFTRAQKAAEKVLIYEDALARSEGALPYAPRLRAMAHVLAAESAHALQDQTARDDHVQLALNQSLSREAQELRAGVQLRAARWALDDRDMPGALRRLNDLPRGTRRRTLALRLRFKTTRLAGQPEAALETARLLAKHGAFSALAARGIVRGLALELIGQAHDPAQLQKAWNQLDETERQMPPVALEAAQRLLQLEGDVALAQQWLMPVWQQMAEPGDTLEYEQRLKLVEVLEMGLVATHGSLDSQWLSRVEAAQTTHPADPLLLYLCAVLCRHMNLWGRAQQMLKLALPQLKDERLRRRAWRALALLAEQREDASAAAVAWRMAGQI